MATVTNGKVPGGVRALDEGDVPACAELARDRDWPPEEAKWRLLLSVGDGLGIDDPDGGLAAAVTVTCFGPDLAVIGMLLVAARHGRQGLGGELMRHALARAADRVVYLYATPLGRPLYERLDFHVDGGIVKHVGAYQPDPAVADPPVTGLSVRPPSPADRDGVLRLDRAVFGADRSALLAGLAAVGDRVVVVEDHRGLLGHAATWREDGLLTIGPVVAHDDAAAQALVQALAAGETGTVRVDISASCGRLADWAADRGLLPTAQTPIMVHHGHALPGARHQLYAPVMLALG